MAKAKQLEGRVRRTPAYTEFSGPSARVQLAHCDRVRENHAKFSQGRKTMQNPERRTTRTMLARLV